MADSKDFKAKNPIGMYPMLETDEGNICGAVPICKYICRQSNQLYAGNGALDRAQVDQWVNWACTNLIPNAIQVLKGIYGSEPIYESAY
jgi:glutathione S-transferase